MKNTLKKSSSLILILVYLSLFAYSYCDYTISFHETYSDPRAITLLDGTVLATSTSGNVGDYIILSRFDQNGNFLYTTQVSSVSYDEYAQLVVSNKLEYEPVLRNHYYLGLHKRNSKASEYILSFQDKFSDYSFKLISDRIFTRKSYTSLKNGYILVGAMTKNTKGSGYNCSISFATEDSFNTKEEFTSPSDLISCFETQKNDIFCAYVSEASSDITTISLKELKFECNEYSEPIIKTTENDSDPTTPPVTIQKIPYDVLYLIDATGSMSVAIADVQDYCKKIAKKLNETLINYDLKYGVVFYRDLREDPTEVSKILDFTSDMEKFQKFVDSEKASGGGDANEDWVEAYSAALDRVHWRDGLKVIIHLTDYSGHGVGYSLSNTQTYITSKEGEKMDNVTIRLCETKDLYIHGFEISTAASYSFKRMNEVCKNYRKLKYSKFNENDFDLNGLIERTTYVYSGNTTYFVNLVTNKVTYSTHYCKQTRSSEQIIKIGYDSFSYIQADAINDSTMGMIYLSPKKNCYCTTPVTEGYDLFFIKSNVYDVDNFESYRYEFLYDKVLYQNTTTIYDPKFISLSEKRVVVACISTSKLLHVMVITEGVKVIFHFDIVATGLSNFSTASFVRFGQSIGIVFLATSSISSHSRSNIQILNYPTVNQIGNKIIPLYTNITVKFTHDLINNYFNTITSHYIYIDYIDSNLVFKSSDGAIIKIGELKETYYTSLIFSGKQTGYFFINYTAIAIDSVDGEIRGQTGYVKVLVPKCFDGCVSCWEKSTSTENNCLIGCQKGYYHDSSLTSPSYNSPYIYGDLFSCPKCAKGCTECNRGQKTVGHTSKGDVINPYCLPKKCSPGYYYVENNETYCLDEKEILQYSEWKNETYYLERNETHYLEKNETEIYWKKLICHKHCKTCNRPGTDANNNCTSCIQDYHFIYGEPIPGNCYTDKEEEGYFVNETDDKYHLCDWHMKGCEMCSNSSFCTKCKSPHYLLIDTHQCNKTIVEPEYFCNISERVCHRCSYHLKGCNYCTPDGTRCTYCQQYYVLRRSIGECIYNPQPNDSFICPNELFENCTFCNEYPGGVPSCYRCQLDTSQKMECKECESNFTLVDSDNKSCYDERNYKCNEDYYTLDKGIHYNSCEEGCEHCKSLYCKKLGLDNTNPYKNYTDYQETLELKDNKISYLIFSGGAGTLTFRNGQKYIKINSKVEKIHLTKGYFSLEINANVSNLTIEGDYCSLFINAEVGELNLKNEGYGHIRIYSTVKKIYVEDWFINIYANYPGTKIDEIKSNWGILSLYFNTANKNVRRTHTESLIEIIILDCGNAYVTCPNDDTLPDFDECAKCGKTFNSYDNITVTHCGHIYHTACADSHNTCPVCKSPLIY